MAGSRIDGIALAAIGAGSLFLYSGIRGKSISSEIQGLIRGKALSAAAAANPITSPSAAGAAGSAAPAKGSYSHDGLMKLWQQAGGSAAAANNAACHAVQESGGNPGATSGNPDGGTNVGLWQLDTPGGKGAGYTIEQLKQPALNARITVQATGGGQDWSAWSTPGC
jgi:hypothetical protein